MTKPYKELALYLNDPCKECGQRAVWHCEDCGACDDMQHAQDCVLIEEGQL